MKNNFTASVAVGGLVAVMCFFGTWAGNMSGRQQIMQQAFERGHAVECPGKTGYYWECANE